MSDLRCPRCLTPLEHLQSAAVCARCGGVFLGSAVTDTVARALDPGSQRAAQDAAALAEQVARTKDASPCPVCRIAMRRYRFGPHLEVDSCHHHGSWYDKGELARLKHALELGGVAEEVAVAPAAAATGSGLELEERVRNKPPAPRPLTGGIDPGVQQKINDLARWEADEERRRARRTSRLFSGNRYGDRFGDNDYDAIDAVFDVIRFLR